MHGENMTIAKTTNFCFWRPRQPCDMVAMHGRCCGWAARRFSRFKAAL